MQELAVLLRSMQLAAHNFHNLVARTVFMQDHEMLGDLYAKYEQIYDGIIERMIGLDLPVNLNQIQLLAAQKIQQLPVDVKENKQCFQLLLQLEKQVCMSIEALIAQTKLSEGTRQMLGNICDESESRQYKLKQRVK